MLINGLSLKEIPRTRSNDYYIYSFPRTTIEKWIHIVDGELGLKDIVKQSNSMASSYVDKNYDKLMDMFREIYNDLNNSTCYNTGGQWQDVNSAENESDGGGVGQKSFDALKFKRSATHRSMSFGPAVKNSFYIYIKTGFFFFLRCPPPGGQEEKKLRPVLKIYKYIFTRCGGRARAPDASSPDNFSPGPMLFFFCSH
jgi:hypothetical protein